MNIIEERAFLELALLICTLKDRPNEAALLWTDEQVTHRYSFRDMSMACNKLLNFLRAQGMLQGDVILTQLSLQVINWQANLATIKCSFRRIPL